MYDSLKRAYPQASKSLTFEGMTLYWHSIWISVKCIPVGWDLQ